MCDVVCINVQYLHFISFSLLFPFTIWLLMACHPAVWLHHIADNGGEVHQGASNWPLRGSKGSHHEGGIRAIGFVTGPLVARKGTVNNQMIHISDWLPTLAHLAGITPNASLAAKLDGFNQWETIR